MLEKAACFSCALSEMTNVFIPPRNLVRELMVFSRRPCLKSQALWAVELGHFPNHESCNWKWIGCIFSSMRIELSIEHEIAPHQHDQITSLRNESFPDAVRERSYFKQLPHFRLLAEDDGILIGHLGVDHRVIRVGDTILSIFGIIDLFVASQRQGNGIASSLLTRITEKAEQNGIDFILLHAVDERLYIKNGFRVISPYLKSLWLYDFENYGVGIERLDNLIYIKSTSENVWPDGTVDIMGYLF